MGRPKNILSDTDSASGKDNRYGNAVLIGRVSEVNCDKVSTNVRVIMPDRVDHEGNPLITKPVPVLQVASTAKKSFAVPRVGTNVAMIKMPNGTANYLVIGGFYTTSDPPPVDDPMLDYVEYDDGSTMQFDASNGTLTWKLKGDMNYENEGSFVIKLKGDFTVDIEGDVLVKAPNIKLEGKMEFKGDIEHTGNMVTHGVHQDDKGFHQAGGAGAMQVMANTEEWKFTSDTADAASAGQVGLDAAAWRDAHTVHLSMITANGRDMTLVYNAVTIGHELLLQAKADSTRYAKYTVIGETAMHGGWWTFPVRLVDSNGTVPANNALTMVTLIQPDEILAKMSALEARIAQLEARHGS